MKIRVNRISIHQSSKTIALFYFVLMVIYCLPLAAYAFYTGQAGGSVGAIGFLIAPVIYLPILYLFHVIMFWIYNQVAAAFGGIEAEFDDHSNDNT